MGFIVFLFGLDLPLWAASAARRHWVTLSMHLGWGTHESAAGAGERERGEAARWHPPLYRTVPSYDASSPSPHPICLHLDVDSATTRCSTLSLCSPFGSCSCSYSPGVRCACIGFSQPKNFILACPHSHQLSFLFLYFCGHPLVVIPASCPSFFSR
jgi:hypothetical protein